MKSTPAQLRYSLEDALRSVPVKDYDKVRSDLKLILGVTTRTNFDRYRKGQSMPTYAKAKAIEVYFLKNYNIKEVWKEVDNN